MTRKLGENIQREWDSDLLACEVWDALQLFNSDPPAAFAGLTELAEGGSALAMLYLGAAYFRGRGGTVPDAKLGEYWTERSARAGSIEAAFGRVRDDVRNAPRPLDVDLILVGDRRSDDDQLVLPHPRAHERAFVLAPWHDVDPDAVLPGHGPVADLLVRVDQGGVRRSDLPLVLQEAES